MMHTHSHIHPVTIQRLHTLLCNQGLAARNTRENNKVLKQETIIGRRSKYAHTLTQTQTSIPCLSLSLSLLADLTLDLEDRLWTLRSASHSFLSSELK